MRTIQALLVSLLFLYSCQQKPLCDLPDDQLVRALADIQVAEVAAQNLAGAVKDSVLQVYYDQIFQIHNIESETFRACFEELQQNPDRMALLFEKVLEELNRQRAQVKGGEEKKTED